MINISHTKRILLTSFYLVFYTLANTQSTSTAIEDVIQSMLNEEDNYFYLDTANYPKNRNELPIGIFDSGTGGLTVFNSIIQLDSFYNKNHDEGKDDIKDFINEKFIYLGDHANMPYGNYHKENKDELLQEHIIKDVHFLLADKYYPDSKSNVYKTDKLPVKSIVIACNTATAYGTEKINLLMELSGLDIKVIGVIDAGVKGALKEFENNKNGIIGVLATNGTVSSNGYENAINRMTNKNGMKGNIEVFSQGGIGIAESLDGDTDYYNIKVDGINLNYKGPDLNSGIDSTLFDSYNFDFSDRKMLCDNDNLNDCNLVQINDPVNYMRFHLVSLMEQIRISKSQNKLKVIILGCTHYPFLTNEINLVLNELFNIKTATGEYKYRPYMTENIKLIT